ncbi:manganese catalase family protein, partial [Variovorax sp. RCC_210]|uniref:manganese catalase family protein n=1 Tax=Variovorax sp. RCC_210 TaxID=3239217 RepID=UPI0035233F75
LGFLMTREIAHQKSFEKALYAITPNFPPGKLPGDPRFTNVYFDMSKGGEVRGPWNQGPQWEFVDEPEQQVAVDGEDGQASVQLTPEEETAVAALASRTASDPLSDPQTGAELGMSEDAVLDQLNDQLKKSS